MAWRPLDSGWSRAGKHVIFGDHVVITYDRDIGCRVYVPLPYWPALAFSPSFVFSSPTLLLPVETEPHH